MVKDWLICHIHSNRCPVVLQFTCHESGMNSNSGKYRKVWCPIANFDSAWPLFSNEKVCGMGWGGGHLFKRGLLLSHLLKHGLLGHASFRLLNSVCPLVCPFIRPSVNIYYGCLVSTTPLTVFYRSFWNFAGVFFMVWGCACGLDRIMSPPVGLGDILLLPWSSVHPSVCHKIVSAL